MNYYEILFLIRIGVVIPSNCLGCYCLIVLGGNKHPGEVHYPGALFRVAIIRGYILFSIVWALIVQGPIIWGTISRVAMFGGQLSWGAIVLFHVLPVAALFFWKFYFSFKTTYKELIWCTNNPNAHIRTFCKCWSFIWRCFFPSSILKYVLSFAGHQASKG